MPQLPVYNSQQNINTNPEAPMRDEATQPFKDQQKVLGVMADITQKMSDQNDVMQYTDYKTKTNLAIANQKAAAANDPNINNLQYHVDLLKKIKDDGLSNISNAQVRQKASSEMDYHIEVGTIQMAEDFKKKQMLQNEINLDAQVKLASQERASASNAALAKQIDDNIINSIKDQVAVGLITEPRGRKLIDDYRVGPVDLDIMNDNSISKDESYVYAELKKGSEGRYPDLTDKERADRLEKVELHVRRNKIMDNYNTKQNQDKNEKDLLLNLGSPQITEGSIKDLSVSTGIRPSFGDAYTKSMYTVPAEETNHEAFNKIKMMQLDGKKGKDINTKILESVEQLTADDRKSLVESQYDPLDQKTINIKASAQALYEWAKTEESLMSPGKASNEVVFNFLQRVQRNPDGNIDEIIKGVQKDYIKKVTPATTLLEDVPNIIGNRNKIRSVYKKESKAGGKPATVKPISAAYSTNTIGFDDL